MPPRRPAESYRSSALPRFRLGEKFDFEVEDGDTVYRFRGGILHKLSLPDLGYGCNDLELTFTFDHVETTTVRPERPTPRSSGPEGSRHNFRGFTEDFRPMGKCKRCGRSGPVGDRCPNPECSAEAERRRRARDAEVAEERRRRAEDFFRTLFNGMEIPGMESWRALLGHPATLQEAEASFRRLAKERHPDRPGGSDDAMAELNAAIAAARKVLR